MSSTDPRFLRPQEHREELDNEQLVQSLIEANKLFDQGAVLVAHVHELVS